MAEDSGMQDLLRQLELKLKRQESSVVLTKSQIAAVRRTIKE